MLGMRYVEIQGAVQGEIGSRGIYLRVRRGTGFVELGVDGLS